MSVALNPPGTAPHGTRPAPSTPAVPLHHVPAALSSFVGRSGSVDHIVGLLDDARLVTLAGPGGVGKTRLAREVAECLAEHTRGTGDRPPFAGGVWWVDLAAVPPGADPAPAVAAALGVRPSPGAGAGGDLADVLAAAVGSAVGLPREWGAAHRLLLVLDNCEQVVDACADLVDHLLRRVPGLGVLATSREALGVEGEVVWPVTGLSHPPRAASGSGDPSLEALAGYDAVVLFVERARAVQPGFALTARTAPAVAALCARLDGLPLALELAAAQVGTLGIDALAARLDDVFAVLTRGRRSVLPRHRTLRALLDWSYHLLAPAEQALLARLGVFRGAFPLDAVETVGADAVGEGAAVVSLGRLVEQSLVDVRDDDGETRYRLLETVRQYALTRLAESPVEERAARARHAAWVDARVTAAADRTWSAALQRTVRALERDVDEIRAALDWATADGGDAMTAVRIAAALAWFWYSAVPWPEARARTTAALAAADAQGIPDSARPPADQAALADLLYPISGLAFFAGEPDRMLPLSARAESLWDAVDAARAADPALDRQLGQAAARGRATMRGMAGLAHAMLGAFDTALADMGAGVALMAGAGGDRWWHAVLLQRRGLIAAWAGRLDEAGADYTAAVPLLRAVDDTWFLSNALEGMAGVALARGELGMAAAHARDSVAVLADDPDPWFISRGLDTLAAVAVAAGAPSPEHAAAAARLLGAASALRARCGAEVIGPDRAAHARTLTAVQAALGSDFAHHWDAGTALDVAGACALAAAADVLPGDVRPSAPRVAARETPDTAVAGTLRGAPDRVGAPADGAVAGQPAARPGAPVQVLTFGSLTVSRDGVPLGAAELTPAKARELLLYLALHPGGRTKEQVALALWPDASPAQVRNAFHVTMHQLRRVLGRKDAIAFDGRAYALARGSAGQAAVVETDVDAVLVAADAVRRADQLAQDRGARGPEEVAAVGADGATLLAWRHALDLAGRGALGDGGDAGDWIVPPQARVRSAWGDGMEALARLHARRGAPSEAAMVLEALALVDPLREAAHRALMACYVAAGEPARALVHYDELTALLAREVGAAPARDTAALAASIRQAAVAGSA
jgi:predicted ATPase/DNA-binding SARP family transcriptional activator